MNLKKYSIFLVPLVAVLVVAAVAYNETPEASVGIKEVPLSPSEPKHAPTLAEFGSETQEDRLSDKAPRNIAKFTDVSEIDSLQADTDLLQVKEDSGYVYYLYGPPESKLTNDTSVKEFSDNGGVIVRTIVTTNPAAALQHIDQTASNYFEIKGMSTFWYESSSNYPAYLEIYPGDERKINIIASSSIEELVEMAKRLDIAPVELDLDNKKTSETNQKDPIRDDRIRVEGKMADEICAITGEDCLPYYIGNVQEDGSIVVIMTFSDTVNEKQLTFFIKNGTLSYEIRENEN